MDELTTAERRHVAQLCTPEATREWAEENISKARSPVRLAALRRILNSASPAVRIPPEILGDIFGGPSHTEATSWSNWLQTMTRVCHQWRAVVLATPSLWSTVSLDLSTNSSFAEACFENSGSSMLSLYVSGDIRDPAFVRDMLVVNAARIRLLHVDGKKAEDILLPPFEMPAVEDLTIEGGYSVPALHPLMNQFTRVTSLRLAHFYVPWTSRVFQGLRYLDLQGAIFQNADKFLNILELCPELRSIRLSEFGEMVVPTTIVRRHIIALPVLVRLHLLTSPSVAKHVLKWLATPSLSYLILDLQRGFERSLQDSGDSETLLRTVLRYIQPLPFMKNIRRLGIHLWWGNTSINAYTGPGYSESERCMSVCFSGEPNTYGNFDEAINAFAGSASRVESLNLELLHLKGPDTRTPVGYRQLLGAFSVLSELRLELDDSAEATYRALFDTTLRGCCDIPKVECLCVWIRDCSGGRVLFEAMCAHGAGSVKHLTIAPDLFAGPLFNHEEREVLRCLVDTIEIDDELPIAELPLEQMEIAEAQDREWEFMDDE